MDSTGHDSMSYTQFQSICSNMQAEGINVYTIALDLTDPTAVTQLQQCVPTGNYFTASSSATLDAAFTAIIKKLTQIRITK